MGHLIKVESTFLRVVRHVRAIEKVCIETYGVVVRGPIISTTVIASHPKVGIISVDVVITLDLLDPWR